MPGRPSSAIPRNWEVSADWMTPIIAAHHPGAVVSDVRRVGGSDGTSSRAVLELTYASGSGPETVFAKTKGDPLRRAFQWMTENAFIEGRLVQSDVELPIEHPRFYAGVVNRLQLNDMIVMEDVAHRDAVLNDATRPLTVDEVAAGLRGLARLHSSYWNFDSSTHPALSWVRPCRANATFRFLVRLGCSRGIPRLIDHLPAEVASLGPAALVELWRRQVVTVGQGPATLLHGDAHVGNTYTLPDGQVGFYDWGVVRRGNWSFDVGYFIISTLDVADRRAHAADLIELYRRALDVPDAQRPTSEEAWTRFRASPPYGLAIWITTGAEDQYQAPEVCASLANRFAHAFLDLDTPAALQELGA
ncbi:phosphotransferase [Aquihabitans sp. McL0605]|uniref:phosphotransferase n=1 Tax=Aquihabitans sp. McL0605 TaxID=3415671 RepID=UPI003CEB3D67